MARRLLRTVLAVVAIALLVTVSGSPRSTREGGTLLVGMQGGLLLSIDPAFLVARHVLSATCTGLMRVSRQGPAQLQTEIAAAYPKITDKGKTYTFTIRKGIRFSTGAPVTARSFAFTINRILDPRMIGNYAPSVTPFQVIVGAQDVIDGKAATAAGIVARGNTLIIRLTKPAGDFAVRVAAPSFCVLPETVPIHPEGVRAPVPAAGPYFVADYIPNEHVLLKRNRFYRGDRPHHVDRFVVDLTLDAATILDRVERNELDVGIVRAADYGERAGVFARKYGVNRSRFFVAAGSGRGDFQLNTSRPLFRNNLRLRQAVNFAVDRKALMREAGSFGGNPSDQYLTPALLGFKDEHVYPLKPDLRRAKALSKGRLRGGKAVLYTADDPLRVAQAQILKRNLKAIGLELEIVAFPISILFGKYDAGGEPYDIAWVGWIFANPDPLSAFECFDGRTIGKPGNCNLSYFDSPKYNRLLNRAGRLPAGRERYRMYGELDADIARNGAPAIPYEVPNALALVSTRVGCVVTHPTIDLAALCLK